MSRAGVLSHPMWKDKCSFSCHEKPIPMITKKIAGRYSPVRKRGKRNVPPGNLTQVNSVGSSAAPSAPANHKKTGMKK